jgi:hypothetical protein
MRNLNDPYVNPELGNLNIESTYGLDTDEPASAGPLEFVPKNMCDESRYYKKIIDRMNNMSDIDIEQRRIEDNLEKKIYKKIIKSLLKKL